MRPLIAILLVCICAVPCAAQDEKIGGKTVKQWTAALRSSESRVRFQAVAGLYEEGAEAAPLVKELIPLLKDTQPTIRRAVAQTLANCKADAAPAVPALVAALKDSDYWVRYQANAALAEVGASAGPHLINLLDDKDATIRYYAIVTINGLGLQDKDIAKALSKSAKDANTNVRQAALFALSKMETDDLDVFAILGAALADKEKQVRLSAAALLVGKGKEGAGALAKAAENKDVSTRMLALQAIAALGEEIDEKGVLALRKALEDNDLKIRQTAALGLAQVARNARSLGGDKELFDALAKLLKEKDTQLRRTAVHALGQIGSDDADEIKTVAGALKDADVMVRSFTVQALAKYATDTAAEDIRALLHGHLIDSLKDADRRVQFLSAQALTQQGAAAVEPLVKVVEEGKGMQRLWAATILGEIGPGTFAAVAPLEKMAKDASPDARRVAQNALLKIMGDGK
jgi:HEAT repeat protein